MQFDWTLALPITLLLVYFLFILQRYVWRIYKRFRLPSDVSISGAFNVGGQLGEPGDGQPGGGVVDPQQEAAYQAEMQAMRDQYAHLPESVRAQMGIGGGDGGGGPPPGIGGAGPSGAGPSRY